MKPSIGRICRLQWTYVRPYVYVAFEPIKFTAREAHAQERLIMCDVWIQSKFSSSAIGVHAGVQQMRYAPTRDALSILASRWLSAGLRFLFELLSP